MTDNTIRVQLPGGPPYAPALNEAVAKTVSRSSLDPDRAAAVTTVADKSIGLLNRSGAAMITLEMTVAADLAVKLTAKDAKTPSKSAIDRLLAHGEDCGISLETRATKTAFTVRFRA